MVLIATYEAEATGQTGIATACPEFPDLPGDDFTIPEIEDLGRALVTAASVNYLPPQTKAWTVRTAEATEHLYADPFWTSRTSSFASIDAILLRCGVGYIKRSTDGGQNWTNITPATDPPNSGSDTPAPTAETITYIQGEGSYITESEHVFIARWQNTSDEWRSWIAYTDDDGENWTWQALSGDSSEDNVYQTTGDLDTMSNNGNHIAPVNSTDYAVTWWTASSGTTGRNYLRIVRTGESGTPSMSNTVSGNADSDSFANKGSSSAVGRMSDSRVVMAWQRSSDRYLIVDVFEYDESSMTLTLAESSAHNIGRTDGYSVDIVGVSAQKALIAVRGSEDSELYHISTDSDGESHSLGSALTYLSSVNSHSFLLKLTSLESYLFYVDPSDDTLYGRRIDTSGTNPSFGGSAVTISSDVRNNSGSTRSSTPIIATHLYDGLCLIIYTSTDDLYGYVRLVNLQSASVGNAILYSDTPFTSGRWYDYLASSDDNSQARIIYSSIISGGFTYTIDVSISGATLTPSPPVLRDFTSAYSVITYLNGNYYASCQGVGGTGEAVVFGSGAALKVLGASISKGLGDTLYLTAWGDNGELIYQVRSMADLSLIGAYSLGTCTEEELDNKTYFAMPYAAFGDDAFFWLYGRFAPSSVGLSQIIYSADSGATLTVFEASWGTAYCGSLIDDFGLIFAAWCNGNQAKLYTGQWDASLELKSTMLFPAAINPFSMVYNFYDDSLYAAAARGNSLMVIKANSPFTSWKDITYDHSTSNGINAIVAL
jgi:hypothetical protein